MYPNKLPLPEKVFIVNLFNKNNYPVLNTIAVTWENALFQNFFGNLFFVLKFTVSTFIIRLGFRASSVLFPTLITFCVFGIAIKWFVNAINFVRIWLFKSSFSSAYTTLKEAFSHCMDQNCLLHLSQVKLTLKVDPSNFCCF